MKHTGKQVELTYSIIGAAMEVHKTLGPGLLESAYEGSLAEEFSYRGMEYKRQLTFPLIYRTKEILCDFRVDFLIEETVIVEIKAVESILPIHEAQLLTYLRIAKKEVGLLINFHTLSLKDGIRRRVL
jgi:GxxExxY protein